ncbi:ABC1 kinase family protein [Arthrobacter sp. JSM 101049]|uniref:ABC1 kinase family protein n=1 Tax=Arthrobacter sp. JSM 101049 TaxID=929097 RepID=UPI003563D883
MDPNAGIAALGGLGWTLTVILGAVFLALQAWIVAGVSRRVLGVPVGWPRSIAVGLLMSAGLSFVVRYLFRAAYVSDQTQLQVSPPVALMFAALALIWVFALGVALLMVLEITFPTGTLPSPIRLFTGWKTRRAHSARYFQVMRIAVRHGLLAQARGLNRRRDEAREDQTARSLREALNEAGVTFVKLGQMLSSRRDLLSEPYIRELSHLQTQAAPEPWPVMEAALAASLGRAPQDAFASIEQEPLASASVAQVHRATLHDGTRVVVKVQRPSALKQVERDRAIVVQIAGWLERSAPWARRLGVSALARGFSDSLAEELDYRTEAENMQAIAASLSGFEVTVPQVHTGFSGPRLLVMDELDGQPVGSAGAALSQWGPDRRRVLARELLGATLHQISGDGVFHADLHPGNIFITREGGLALLDFGAVGRLDPASQQSLNMLLFAIDKNDNQLATDALLGLLDRPEDFDERGFERSLGQLLVRYRNGFGGQGGSEMFTALFALIVRHGFSVPPQVAAALRALGALEGTLSLIDPALNVVAAAREAGRKIIGAQFTAASLKDELEVRAMQLLPTLREWPRRLNKITEDVERGRLSVNVRVLAHPADRGFLNRLVQQVVVALLAGAATLAAIILITTESGPFLTENVRLHAFFGYVLLFMGFILALRSVVLVFQRDRDDEHDTLEARR